MVEVAVDGGGHVDGDVYGRELVGGCFGHGESAGALLMIGGRGRRVRWRRNGELGEELRDHGTCDGLILVGGNHRRWLCGPLMDERKTGTMAG